MSSNKFLTIASNGAKRLLTAIANRVDSATSGNKILMTRSDGYIDNSFIPPGVGGEATITAVATEALAAGDFVNVYSNSGVRSVRKADATNGRQATGFVLAAVANAATATIILRGENTALTTIAMDTIYYLGITGTATTTAPTTNGHLIQELGVGISTTSILFEYDSGAIIG